MTNPVPPRAGTSWLQRPGVVLAGLAAMIAVVALFAPDWGARRDDDARLTTNSAAPMGAQLMFDLTRRLAWNAERRVTRYPPPGPHFIHAILGGSTPFPRRDVGRVLDRVRDGAALFVIASGSAFIFADSLHARAHTVGFTRNVDSTRTVCPARRRLGARLWSGDRAFLQTIRWRGAPPEGLVSFIEATPDPSPRDSNRVRTPSPAIVGFPYGRGRIVLALDGDVVRNDALRVCNYGLDVAVVRALEYLSAGGDQPRRHIVFDEFHQAYGEQPGAMTTIARYLSRTTSGNVFMQLCVAGVVLLAALAPRAIPPRAVVRIERRSPFEHVDALARAYMLVDASRTATARLVRGLRRRVEPGAFRATRALAADAFLEHVVREFPALAADGATVRHALAKRVSAREFVGVGEALARIESSLTRI